MQVLPIQHHWHINNVDPSSLIVTTSVSVGMTSCLKNHICWQNQNKMASFTKVPQVQISVGARKASWK